MLRAYLKIIFAFIAILSVALGVSVLFYFWENFIEPSRRARAMIAKIDVQAPERIDLGKGEYEAAKSFLIQGDLLMARKRLANVMMMYKDSPYYKEAKRIIGEQNMDMLLSKDPMPGKEEYIVQRGDSLLKIESHSKSTIQYISYINNLRTTSLSVGDPLIVCPLEFTVVISTNTGRSANPPRALPISAASPLAVNAAAMQMPAANKSSIPQGIEPAIFQSSSLPSSPSGTRNMTTTAARATVESPAAWMPTRPDQPPKGSERVIQARIVMPKTTMTRISGLRQAPCRRSSMGLASRRFRESHRAMTGIASATTGRPVCIQRRKPYSWPVACS